MEGRVVGHRARGIDMSLLIGEAPLHITVMHNVKKSE
jgi:hypothetical protein